MKFLDFKNSDRHSGIIGMLFILWSSFSAIAQHAHHRDFLLLKDSAGYVLTRFSEDSIKLSETHFLDSTYLTFHGQEVYFWRTGGKKEVNFYQKNKLVRQEFFYESGTPEMVKVFSDDLHNYLYLDYWDSTGVQLLKNGQGELILKTSDIVEKGDVRNGMRNGDWIGSSRTTRKLLFTEKYQNNALVNGRGEGKRKYTYLERKTFPVLKTDNTQLMKRLMGISFEAIGSGVTYVDLDIDKSGKILTCGVRSKYSEDDKRKIEEIFRKYSEWLPGKQFGIPVESSVTYPVRICTMEE